MDIETIVKISLLTLSALFIYAICSPYPIIKKQKEYRIKEFNNSFNIQQKVYIQNTPFSKKTECWKDLNYSKNKVTLKDTIINDNFSGYGTIDAAINRVKQLLEEPKFHYLGENLEEKTEIEKNLLMIEKNIRLIKDQSLRFEELSMNDKK